MEYFQLSEHGTPFARALLRPITPAPLLGYAKIDIESTVNTGAHCVGLGLSIDPAAAISTSPGPDCEATMGLQVGGMTLVTCVAVFAQSTVEPALLEAVRERMDANAT